MNPLVAGAAEDGLYSQVIIQLQADLEKFFFGLEQSRKLVWGFLLDRERLLAVQDLCCLLV